MIAFPEKVCVPIVNHITGRRYTLIPAAHLEATSDTLVQIVAICNEPEIYCWLFREALEGHPYSEKWARDWIEWSKSGWRSSTHFVFAVVDEMENVAAACDIKSNDLNAEIGYWCSCEHRGVMTNAVVAMCDIAARAGFVALFARAKDANVRSKAVLQRAGFARGHDPSNDHERFIRTLNSG